MPANKRSATQILYDKATAMRLKKSGLTHQEITDYINRTRPYNLDRSQISRDLSSVRYEIDVCDSGFVYVFNMRGTNLYKIGRTKVGPLKRLQHAKTDNPFLIASYFIYTDKMIECETATHKKFSANNVVGEFFRISKSEIENLYSFLDSWSILRKEVYDEDTDTRGAHHQIEQCLY